MAMLSALFADVGGTGAASHVTAGAVLTLVIPLALLVLVLAWWWLSSRRGWPALPTERHPAPPRHRWHLRHRDE
ncbi:MAG: hypothetical protein ACXVRH_09525 [Thermoleophilaceae bacterium]